MDRWARTRDREQFDVECRLIAGMVEQKMERYESALARLRDVCARHDGMIPLPVWRNWIGQVLTPEQNYPCIRLLIAAPSVYNTNRTDHELLGKRNFGTNYAILTPATNATCWLPVWNAWSALDKLSPAFGTDLGAQIPSLLPALGDTFGSVFATPVKAGEKEAGFWFAIPVTPDELPYRLYKALNAYPPDQRHEEGFDRRRRIRTKRATGLVAALISGDQFVNEFNAGPTLRVHAQFFSSRVPEVKNLLNPTQPPPAHPLFTQDLLLRWYRQRWTLRLSSAPLFEQSSLRYRAWLIWGLGTALSLGVATTLAWQMRGRWREAALAARLRETLGHQERLSRDLHDGTLQSVYAVGLGLQRAQNLMDTRPRDAAQQLIDTRLTLQGVVNELREFVHESDPSVHAEVPLGEALQGVLSHFKSASDADLQLSVVPGADSQLTPASALQLLNIAREALSNSVRHSGARRVVISIQPVADSIRLEISDDGCGFNPKDATKKGRGLSNLAVRVEEIGATHHWESAPGEGAHLIVELPIRHERPS